jgi:hypothetical protein
MLWIKRNLFLAVGGLIALLLLGLGIFYFWTNQQKNKEIEAKLEENKATLTRLISQKPYPSRTNITLARQEVQRARDAIGQARMFFQPVPFTPVKDEAFKTLLDNTLYELQRKAEQTSVILPSKGYAFTFEHQKRQLQFPPEAFPALPQQLAEIKTICDLLFDAKINRLITLRRARVYTEEPLSQIDHHDMSPEVDEAMGIASNPYELVVHAFSTELASALESFYKSTNGLVVKSVQVEPVPAGPADPNQPGQNPAPNPVLRPPPPAAVTPTPVPNVRSPVGTQPQPQPPVAVVRPPALRPGAAASKPALGLKTVISERLLKITLVVDVLRTVPTPAQKA